MNTCLSEKISKASKTHSKPSPLLTKCALITLFVFLTAGLMIRKESVSLSVISAIRSCGSGLIPTLFPFMVISDIFSKLLCGEKSPLALSFITGNVCGFPLGAKMLSDMYVNCAVTESDYRRFLPLCSNPGLIFTVAFAGMTLWNNYIFGCILYITTLISGCLTFLIFKTSKTQSIAPAERDFSQNPSLTASRRADIPVGDMLTNAIGNGTVSMLKICGFVIFFSVLRVLLSDALGYLLCPDMIHAFLCSLLEISGGEIFLAERSVIAPAIYLLLTFFAHGFGGLCILAQISSVIKKEAGIMKSYLLFKLTQGGIAILLSIPYALTLYRL